MGLLGIVNNDIKRVIAYSTLSQLGYMTVALGVSAYSAGDLPPDDARLLQGAAVPRRRLGDHRACTTSRTCARWAACGKHMPITYWTCLVGALALIGTPFFSGFYSKDALIEAVRAVASRGRRLRLLLRAGRRVRHGAVHLPHDLHDLPRQGRAWITMHAASTSHERPLGRDGAAGAARDSLGADRLRSTIGPVLFGGYFGDAIQVLPSRTTCSARSAREFHGPVRLRAARASRRCRSGWRAAGVVTRLVSCPAATRQLADDAARALSLPVYACSINKYYFDWFNENVIARAARGAGLGCCGAAATRC